MSTCMWSGEKFKLVGFCLRYRGKKYTHAKFGVCSIVSQELCMLGILEVLQIVSASKRLKEAEQKHFFKIL